MIDKVRGLVRMGPYRSPDLDRIPIKLVTDCIDILITPTTQTIIHNHLSLPEGSFPSHFKFSLASPLLKIHSQ